MNPSKFLTAMVLLVSLVAAGQVAAMPMLSLVGPDQASPGDVVNFGLQAKDPLGIGAADVSITIDTGVWGFQSIQVGDLLDPLLDSTTGNISGGQLLINIVTLLAIAINNTGLLAEIELQVLPGALPGPTSLTFDIGSTKLYNDLLDEMTYQVTNRSFTVNALPVAAPPALALMVPGLLLLARRRSA